MCCANGSLQVQPGDTMFRACVLLPSPSILRKRHNTQITPQAQVAHAAVPKVHDERSAAPVHQLAPDAPALLACHVPQLHALQTMRYRGLLLERQGWAARDVQA